MSPTHTTVHKELGTNKTRTWMELNVIQKTKQLKATTLTRARKDIIVVTGLNGMKAQNSWFMSDPTSSHRPQIDLFLRIIIIIIIIIIFINCNWVVTRWQWLFNMSIKHEIDLQLNSRPEGYMRSL
jgi:hypothetical protein